MSFNQVFKVIKRLVVAAKIPATEERWKSYEDMNKKIEKLLD